MSEGGLNKRKGQTRRGALARILGAAVELSPIPVVGTLGGIYLKGELDKRAEERERMERAPSEEFQSTIDAQRNIYQTRPTARLDLRTALQVTLKNGTEPTQRSAEILSRIDYVRKHAMEHAHALPEAVRTELKSLIHAQGAQESRYDNDDVSSANAHRIFQFEPATRQELYALITSEEAEGRITYDDPTMKYLTTQVRAVDERYVLAYNRITRGASEALQKIRETFFSDQRAFETQFLVPVLVNTYQAGEGPMIDIMKWFVRNYIGNPPRRRMSGHRYPNGYGLDVFHFMTEHARRASSKEKTEHMLDYGRYSVAYVEGVYAFRDLLKDEEKTRVRQ